jgi:ribose transport system permease protein
MTHEKGAMEQQEIGEGTALAQSAPHPDGGSGEPGATRGPGAGRRRSALVLGAERYTLPVITVLAFLGFSLALPVFRTGGDFRVMINGQALIILLAIVATTSLRAGVVDFSIASVTGVSAAMTARLALAGLPAAACIVAALGLCLAIGIVQAILVVGLGVDSFVLSLGSLTALGGVTYFLTDSTTLTSVPSAVTTFAQTKLLSFPVTTWLSWLAVLVAFYVYQFTPLGRYLLFVGGNAEAAKLAGVRVARIRFAVLVFNALAAGVIGLLLLGQYGSIDPTVPSEFLLPPFAAAFLGASGIIPGRFNALGTLIASYLLVIGINGLQLLGAQVWASDVFNGAALVVAVVLARVLRRIST